MNLDPAALAKTIAAGLRPLNARIAALERAVGVAPSTSSLPAMASSIKPKVRLKTWSADVQFAIDDAVVFDGKLYRATTNVCGLAPNAGAFAASVWQPLDRRPGDAP